MYRVVISSIVFIFFRVVTVAAQDVKPVKITELEKIIAESRTPLVVNFWATWCKPCVEEIPYFMKEVKAHMPDSVQLVLVSLDMKEQFPEGVRSFIHERKFEGIFYWLDETDADYFCPRIDQSWSGVIPATLFINNKTGYRSFVEAKLPEEKLKQAIRQLISSPAGHQ